jgi:aryl carrier-like protein
VQQALTLLERAMQQQRIQVSVMRVDWSRWRGLGVTGRVSPRFAHLLQETKAVGKGDGSLPALAAVRAAGPQERRGLLDGLLRDKVARVLGTSPERLDAARPLLQLGIDSLMAVELRNWVEGELQISVPIGEVMRSPSLARLTDVLLEQLAQEAPVAAGAPRRPAEPSGNGVASREASPGPLHSDVKDLSSEQLDDLLAALLADRDRPARS